MIDSRWRIALHEAGHCVACVALGGRCDGGQVFGDEGGAAMCSELLGANEAFMTAAGPGSEYLAAEFFPPEITIDVVGAVNDADEVTDDPIVSRLAFRRSPSDDAKIAQWAIRGREDEPESWAGRVYFVHHVAAKIVDSHRELIVQLARELFIRGRLSRSEILQITTPFFNEAIQ